MKRLISIALLIAIALISVGLVSCSSQVQRVQVAETTTQSTETIDEGKDIAIEAVKSSLTTGINGNFIAVAYENGYVVNFEDMAYWYVEDGLVFSLNGFAKTYAANTEYKYGIEWEDLF